MFVYKLLIARNYRFDSYKLPKCCPCASKPRNDRLSGGGQTLSEIPEGYKLTRIRFLFCMYSASLTAFAYTITPKTVSGENPVGSSQVIVRATQLFPHQPSFRIVVIQNDLTVLSTIVLASHSRSCLYWDILRWLCKKSWRSVPARKHELLKSTNTPRNNPEGRRPQLHRGGSLKPRMKQELLAGEYAKRPNGQRDTRLLSSARWPQDVYRRHPVFCLSGGRKWWLPEMFPSFSELAGYFVL